MNIFKKLGSFFVLAIGLIIISYTFMFVLEIYPDNCVYVTWPIYTSCLKAHGDQIDVSQPKESKPYTIEFVVKVPSSTLPDDKIFLETNFGSYEMQNSGDGVWIYNLTRTGDIKYRYNRDDLGYMTSEEFEPDSPVSLRSASFGYTFKIKNDEVSSWRYLSARQLSNVPSHALDMDVNITNRPFITGIALGEYTKSGLTGSLNKTFSEIKSDNAKWVMITAENSYASIEPMPSINKLDVLTAGSLKDEIENAKAQGLHVILKTKLCCNNPEVTNYSNAWWINWFDEAGKNIDYYAKLANETNADAILIDYTYGYSMVGNLYSPRNATLNWNKMLDNLKSQYSGEIGFNSFVRENYSNYVNPWPTGSKSLSNYADFYGVEIWSPIADTPSDSQEKLNAHASEVVAHIVGSMRDFNKPVIITGTAYNSYDSCAMGNYVVPTDANGVLPWEPKNPELRLDAVEQAMVYEAFLDAISGESSIRGFFAYGYGYATLPDSLDYSIRGKEAEVVVRNWFGKYSSLIPI